MQRLEGRSLKKVLQNPARKGNSVAISEFPCPSLREWAGVKTADNVRKEYFDHALNDIESYISIENPDTPLDVFQESVMGYTIRDNRYRCMAWVDQSQPKWRIIASEFYDHARDPFETRSLSPRSRKNSAAVKLEKRMWKLLGFENKF